MQLQSLKDRPAWAVFALGVAWCVVVALVLFRDKLMSGSVDLAHHFALVEALRGRLSLPADSAYLAEAAIYPRAAHRTASVLSLFGLAPLKAMATVAVAAALGVWLMLFETARRVSLAALGVAFAVSMILSLASHALVGGEVVENFFYAQLAAEAVFVAAALGGAALIGRRPIVFVVYSVLAVWFCSAFHLLPAMKLALTFMGLAGIEGVARLWRDRTVDRPALAGMIAPALALLTAPSLTTMRKISEHDGGVSFGLPIGLGAETALAGVLVVGGLVLLWPHRRGGLSHATGASGRSILAERLLLIMGLAAAGASMAQLAAELLAGIGSYYAVQKHVFGLVTGAALLAGVAASAMLGRARALSLRLPGLSDGWGGALSVAASLILVLTLYRGPSVLDVPRAATLLEQVNAARREAPLNSGRLAVFSDSRVPSVVDYMATVGVLRAERTTDLLSILNQDDVGRLDGVWYVVTGAGNPKYGDPKCRASAPIGPLIVEKAACLRPDSLAAGRDGLIATYSFKAGGGNEAFLVSGWSTPEGGGVWSDGPRAVVRLPVTAQMRADAPIRLDISTFALLIPQSQDRHVRFTAPGSPPQNFAYNLQRVLGHIFTVVIPAEALRGQTLELAFDIADPVSAAELGVGADARRLGVGLDSIRVSMVEAPQ